MKMNPEVKTEWLERLREPGRKQVKSYLEVEGQGQCCLGVLCEIAAEQSVTNRKVEEDTGLVSYDDYETKELPDVVVDWAGLRNSNINIPSRNPAIRQRKVNGRLAISLAETNDHGMTFAEIADIIEEEF